MRLRSLPGALDPTFFDEFFQRTMIAKQLRLADEFFGHGASGGKLFQDDLQSLIGNVRYGLENFRVDFDSFFDESGVSLAMPFLDHLLDESAVFFDQANGFEVSLEKALDR